MITLITLDDAALAAARDTLQVMRTAEADLRHADDFDPQWEQDRRDDIRWADRDLARQAQRHGLSVATLIEQADAK